MFDPNWRAAYATPGDLAVTLDPRTIQTPALDLIDAALVEAATTPDARLIICMPPQEGKALALDTPIATPFGWSTMGELRVGDWVFDRHGKPCQITWTSPVWDDRPCYTVRTGDGEAIVADAAHEWVAQLTRTGPERLYETTDLAKTRLKNARITGPASLDLPHAELPLDPYVLGAWLGDGHTNGAQITSADPEITDRIRSTGVPCRKIGAKYAWSLAPGGTTNRSATRAVLTDLGVWGDKHVPREYMRASHGQRLALLQGLIDTDGHVIEKGQVEFINMNRRLAEQVRELVFTLGAKAVLTTGRATIAGRDCGERYRVRFYLKDAAYLPRKAVRCKDSSVARIRYVWAEPAESVPVMCIEVNSADHTYLAGRSLLPTHNSFRCSRWFPLWLLHRNPDTRIAIISYESNIARRWGRAVRDTITQHGKALGLRIRDDLAAQHEWQLDGHEGGVYTAGIGGALTGRPVDLLIIDDPIKDRADADSPTIRQNVIDWWTDTGSTRLAPGAPVVLIQTRWHPDDLAGWLLAQEDAHRWKLISIPAQAEALDPADDPLGRQLGEFMASARRRTVAQWEKIKAALPARTWAALYQQRPTPAEGTVWQESWISAFRGRTGDSMHRWSSVLVGVDPAVTSKTTSDETGIVVTAMDTEGTGWVVDDRSLRGTPTEWGVAVWHAVFDWSGTGIVIEDNQGGEMVLTVLQTSWQTAVASYLRLHPSWRPIIAPPVTRVHASRSKRIRAESVAALYEVGRVRHAADGTTRLAALEDQMTAWTGVGDSPDRIDALVHALTALFLPKHADAGVGAARQQAATRRRAAGRR
jgi:hypothetical protein